MKKYAFLVLPLVLLALPADARTALQSSDPAQGARVGESTKIVLRFSGALQPARAQSTQARTGQASIRIAHRLRP